MMMRCSNGHEFNSDFGPECPVCMPADFRATAAPSMKRTVVDPLPPTVVNSQTGAAPAAHAAPVAHAAPSATVVMAGAASKRIVGWVVVERGPQREIDFRLYEGQNRLGRDASAHIVLTDPLVGNTQAIINFDGLRFEIIDLASKNGTFLNDGQRSVIREELQNGDLIRVGDTILKFVRRV
jgi:hypothetical protein